MEQRQGVGIAAGFVTGVAVGWNTTNVGAVASAMASSYGIGLAAVGLFTTALFVTHLASQIPGGRLVDRFGARRICLAGVAVVGCGAAISMIAPNPTLGIAARTLTGIGTGSGFIAAVAYVRRCGGTPFVQGIFGGIGLGAGGFAIAIVPQLVGAFSWRAPYVSSLALALVALGALAIAPADRRGEELVAAPRHAGVLRDRRLRAPALLYSVTLGTALVLSNWVVELLERHGLGADAGTIGALILVLGVFTRPLGGWILHKRPEQIRRVVAVSLLAGCAGTACLALGGSSTVAWIGCALLGIGGGISFSPSFTGAATLRPDAPAAAAGMVNAAASLSILVFTPLVGLTFLLPGEGRLGFALAALAWLAALTALPDRSWVGGAAPPPGPTRKAHESN